MSIVCSEVLSLELLKEYIWQGYIMLYRTDWYTAATCVLSRRVVREREKDCV